MQIKTIKDFKLKGRRVLLRADLNVPRQDGKVTDTARIDRLKPTIDYLRKNGAKIIILSHFGRPGGERNPDMSLAFLAPVLQDRWSAPIRFCQHCIGEEAQRTVSALKEGGILLLENMRFHSGEKANDPVFVKQLAALGDLYVNDAFSASHRAHASTEGLAHVLPAAAGLLMAEELDALDKALGNPARPVAAIAGGSKISTKLGVLNHLIGKVDMLVLGGAMANTFLYADGAEIGASLCEKNMAGQARKIMRKAEKKNCDLILPADSVAAKDISPGAAYKIVDSRAIPAGYKAIDIGPKTVKHIGEKLGGCKTVLWNGPMGVFEIPPFDKGTAALARIVADMTKAGKITSIGGGGDTLAALKQAGAEKDFTYISTAGGAFLEWLEGKPLPGVAALFS